MLPTKFRFIWLTACPQVFSSGGTCTLLPSFLGVHPNFWGCNVPSNASFGGTKKINCILSTQGRAPCCVCKYYAELAKTFFFLSDIGSDRKWGSVWPMAFVSVPPIFYNIVYNLSNFVFYTELNARLPIYEQEYGIWTVSDNDRKLIKLDISLIYVIILWPNGWLVC